MPSAQPTPTVSVIVPARNAADTLGAQLEALAAQRLTVPWEVIVCDNGSTDRTRDVAESWQARLPVRVVDASPRRGPSAARNAGARASRARYLAFADADDVVGTDWLATLVAALDSTPYVGGHVEYDLLRAPGSVSVSWNDAGPFVFTLAVLPQLAATGAGNFGIHRALYQRVGGFEEALQTCEDADLSWRVQLAGHRLAVCTATYHVRTRQTLRSIARQSYGWGAGQATLRYRYAKVIASLPETSAPPAGDRPPPGARVAGLVRRLGAKTASAARQLTGGRARPWLANATWQVGHLLGRRFGTPDTTIEQIEPPADLAEIIARARAEPWRALDTPES